MRDEEDMVTEPIEKVWVSHLADYLAGGCAYRLFLNCPPQNENPGKLMPGYIQAILGSVYHELYQEIKNGEHRDSDLTDLLKVRAKENYSDFVKRGNLVAKENFTSAEFINDTSRKARNLERIRDTTVVSRNSTKSGSGGFRKSGREVYIDGFQERVTGIIDEVKIDNNGIVITDDKTSVILGEDGEVNQSYRFQVITYALLWSEKWGEEVSKIQLRSRSGNVIWSEDKSNFKSEFPIIISKVRKLIKMLDREGETPENLANPSHKNCNFCEHRIDCLPHRNLENQLSQNEACVISGQLERIFPLGVDQFKLTVAIDGKKIQTTVNRNWCEFDEKTKLPIQVRLHAFFPHATNQGKLNSRTTSHFVSKL